MFYLFGAFVDFTHHLEEMGEDFSTKEKEILSNFHEFRKKGLDDFFIFLTGVTKNIAKKTRMFSEDLSFLMFDEILMLVDGSLSSEEADQMQAARKKQYAYDLSIDREIVVTDEPEYSDMFKKIQESSDDFTENELVGNSIIKSGLIRGEVRKLVPGETLKDARDKIIVTSMTNPDTVTFLKECRAIVTDEGGFLCHAANIAREFKIPCVIGTKIATKVLKDGDIVEVDTDKGIVRRI